MRKFLGVLVLALVLGSCTAIDKLSSKIGTAVDFGVALQGKLERLKGKVATVAASAATAQRAADTNKDGNTSTREWLEYLLGGGGLTLLIGMLRNAKSNERKTKIEAELAAMSSRLPASP